jgi:hypothetical protein
MLEITIQGKRGATGLPGLGDLVEVVNHGCLDQKAEHVCPTAAVRR